MIEQPKNKRGEYLGQCRRIFNVLEQWNGKAWREIPDVISLAEKPIKTHFDVEDALYDR